MDFVYFWIAISRERVTAFLKKKNRGGGNAVWIVYPHTTTFFVISSTVVSIRALEI